MPSLAASFRFRRSQKRDHTTGPAIGELVQLSTNLTLGGRVHRGHPELSGTSEEAARCPGLARRLEARHQIRAAPAGLATASAYTPNEVDFSHQLRSLDPPRPVVKPPPADAGHEAVTLTGRSRYRMHTGRSDVRLGPATTRQDSVHAPLGRGSLLPAVIQFLC